MKETDSISPFVRGEEHKHLRDSTVRQTIRSICLTVRLPPPLPLPASIFRGLREEVGGAWAVLDGPSGTLPHALSPETKNDHHRDGGRRLLGHPMVFCTICMHKTKPSGQPKPEREREREKERDADNETNPKTKQEQLVREVRLDVGAVAGVRVEEEERGRVNTRGITNRNGLCFPSAWREEEEKRDDGENKTTNQQKKERERERHQPQC